MGHLKSSRRESSSLPLLFDFSAGSFLPFFGDSSGSSIQTCFLTRQGSHMVILTLKLGLMEVTSRCFNLSFFVLTGCSLGDSVSYSSSLILPLLIGFSAEVENSENESDGFPMSKLLSLLNN